MSIVKLVKKAWLGALVAGALAVILGTACGGETFEAKKTVTVPVASAQDDGVLSISAQGVAAGMHIGSTWGGVSSLTDSNAAGAALYEGNQIQNRALYRFNISEWTEGDITFKVECTAVYGYAGNLEAYVVNDFGSLSLQQSATQSDQSAHWLGGQLLGTTTPLAGAVVETVVPAATVAQYKSADGYIAFMMKATGETTAPTSWMLPNSFLLSSYEHVANNGTEAPSVTWTA